MMYNDITSMVHLLEDSISGIRFTIMVTKDLAGFKSSFIMGNNYVLTYLESQSDLLYFKRFREALNNRGLSLICMVNKLSLAVKCKYLSIPYHIVKTDYYTDLERDERESLYNMREIRSNEATYGQAELLYGSVKGNFIELICNKKPDFVFIMNGESIPTRAIAKLSKLNKIQIRFFELSNIPQKMFVDPIGVNAKSSLFYSINILEDFTVSEFDFNIWKINYLKIKEESNPLRNKKQKTYNWLFILDLIGFWLFNIPANGEKRLWKKFSRLLKIFKRNIKYDKYDYRKGEYIFLPLQMTYDTQLLINSEMSNIDAIVRYINESRLNKIDLVVKIHPLEDDIDSIDKIFQLRNNENFYIVNDNTFELIRFSKKVGTINSTVGLESIIIGKETEFIGNSFYPLLTPKLLKNYLLSYLIDIDYQSKSNIENKVLEEILERSAR